MEKMKDILEAVNLYFEGIHECDVSKLKEVFHPNLVSSIRTKVAFM